MGEVARRCRMPKPTASTTPASPAPTISPTEASAPAARTRAQTRPKAAPLTSSSPGRSTGLVGPNDSGSFRNTSGTATAAIGTFSQNTHCQDRPWVTAPPSTGPRVAASPGHGPVHAEGAAAALARERRVQHRQPQRRDQRSSGPLRHPGRDQPADAGSERTGRGGRREQGQADREPAAPAEPVADGRRGHQQDREGQRVGVDGPLQLLEGRGQIVPDGGERGGHHQHVQDHQEGAEGRQSQRPTGCGRIHRVCSRAVMSVQTPLPAMTER